jgi:nitrite reductase/ring-hydroxylating ferredoxin subunit
MKTKIIALIVIGLVSIIMGSYTAIRFLKFDGKDPYIVIYQVQQLDSGSQTEVEIYRERFTQDLNVVFAVEIVKVGTNRFEYYFTELEDFDFDADHDHHEDDHLRENSEFNIIVIKDGKIYVIHANCPNKICMRSTININSYIYFTNQIICAPHKLRMLIEAGDA